MKIFKNLVPAILLSVAICGCSNAAEKTERRSGTTPKGAQQGMKTYYLGRFAVDVPADYKLEMRSQTIRYAEVVDYKWQTHGNHEHERNELWANKMSEIARLHKPIDKKQIIIEEKDLKGLGSWAKAVQYYGNYLVTESLYWTVLVDYGDVGVMLTIDGADNDMTIANFTNILSHYRYGALDQSARDSFYLNYGKITLPYLEQEKTYARFEGPMEMILRIEMAETHKVEEAGVMDRLVASLAVNFAPGVDVDKIRSGKRTVAGLAGQEIATQMSDDNGKELFFAWEYLGKENSGEYPEIKIGVECPAGNQKEKLKVWDRVLDSFRPLYK